jgi:O-antigen ligase
VRQEATFLRPLPAGFVRPTHSNRADVPDDTVADSGLEALSQTATIAFLAAHIPLALLMRSLGSPVSTAHALLVLAFGITSAVRGRVDRVVMVVGYIAGAEVLWRMTNARILWESGKYGAAAIMLVALLRNGLIRPPALTLAYFALLLPSCVITLTQEAWPSASNQLSFNLSGPLALFLSAWFFATMKLSTRHVRALFLTIASPIIGVLTIAVYGMITTVDLSFIDQSNFATSGGYGPNQVSAVLGLGALLSLFVGTDGRAPRAVRLVMGGLCVVFAVQSALTFSRGGLAAAAGSAAIATLFTARDSRIRAKLFSMVAAVVAVGFLVLPYLNAYTGGELSIRFQDASTTGRDAMARQEFDMFTQNPILGVGPGGARIERKGVFYVQGGPRFVTARSGEEYAAHTEYARLLSEHGTFGLIAMFLLAAAATANIRKGRDPATKGIIAGSVCWSALFMLSSAMRIFLPSLAFGLAFATFAVDESAPERPTSRGNLRRLTTGHPSLKATDLSPTA